ncbi:hypothetical protein [Streptomyces flavovariabilis]|nr:hypothetical protein [Streptomyces flavovariabilis]
METLAGQRAAHLQTVVAELRSATTDLRRSQQELEQRQRELREEAVIVEPLQEVGSVLAAELDLDALVQHAVDAATVWPERGVRRLLLQRPGRDRGVVPALRDLGVDRSLTATASWDTFPGHTPDDVQSGIGVVHNALLLDGPERTVVRSPFHPAPQALLHGVQLDRAGTLGTDAARPSLPDQRFLYLRRRF